MYALRDFQQEVIDLALDENVVMVGETGIGKTFVAIALLTEQDYSDRRAFYLAPTRQLVWQVTAKIRSISTLRANAYCGQTTEEWGDQEWRNEMVNTRVFVCTPDVLRSALEQGFVTMSMINLLVFDECHHVSKRHPYAQVIKMYDPSCKKMPRVFGATACPTRDCAKHMHAKLHKVEHQKAFAAAAPIQFETYENETTIHEPLASTAAVFEKLLRKGRSDAAHDGAHRDKLVNKFLITAAKLAQEWGQWCVDRYIELEMERAAQNASLLMVVPGTMFGFDSAAVAEIMAARKRRERSTVSHRLKRIVELLQERLDGTKDQGIIFVTTRMECRVVCDYLNEKMGDSFACILGQAATRDTAALNLPPMEETLTKFTDGSVQFLVSTSVSVEGIDFPQCSVLVVADRIQSARKLIQLRGRARHEDGVVYYLMQNGDMEHQMHFKIMMAEADAINDLNFRFDKEETVLQQPRSKLHAESIAIPTTGAVLDVDSSIARLNQFCQTLPRQLFTVDTKTMYTIVQETVERRHVFRAKLELPVELKAPAFETELVHSKSMAKATVAYMGCKYLLENGHLDEFLNSVYRKRKATSDLQEHFRKIQ